MASLFAILAGLIHIYIFCLESLFWGRPNTNRIFRVSADIAEHVHLFAFNQGFYNLFLSVAVMGGLTIGLESEVGLTLVVYALLSMMMAALVLIYSNRRLLRAAIIQGLPPLLGLVFLVYSKWLR